MEVRPTCVRLLCFGNWYLVEYDVISVCETWPKDSVIDIELLLPGYYIFQKDRVEHVEGGIFVASISNIRATHRLDLA